VELTEFVGLAAVPVIIGLVEVFKRWIADDRYYPLIGLALGIIINVAIAYQTAGDYLLAVLVGIVAGLAASGLYSGGKAVTRP
jgi:hypothetical protein